MEEKDVKSFKTKLQDIKLIDLREEKVTEGLSEIMIVLGDILRIIKTSKRLGINMKYNLPGCAIMKDLPTTNEERILKVLSKNQNFMTRKMLYDSIPNIADGSLKQSLSKLNKKNMISIQTKMDPKTHYNYSWYGLSTRNTDKPPMYREFDNKGKTPL